MNRHYGRQATDGDPDGFNNEQQMDRNFSKKLMDKFPSVKLPLPSSPITIKLNQAAPPDPLREQKDRLWQLGQDWLKNNR